MSNKFKYNKRTGVWSRILLLSDGNMFPYQDEVMLNPVNIAGYPRTWEEIEEVNVVKYFHQTLPDDIEYHHMLPSDIEREMLDNLSYRIYTLLVHKLTSEDIRHAVLASGRITKGKNAIRGFDTMKIPLATVGNDLIGYHLKAQLFGKTFPRPLSVVEGPQGAKLHAKRK